MAQASCSTEARGRRSVTLPLRPAESTRANASSPIQGPTNSQVETLYAHPSVRIVSFVTASRSTAKQNSTNGFSPLPMEEAGTLPWTSTVERLIALGPLQVYRPSGSVAFLRCSGTMHPILPKSQCWCVDDASTKFVLQIRPPLYWRIELSTAEAENPQIFKGLKRLALPEQPSTPIKKRPWKPVETPTKRNITFQSLESTPGDQSPKGYFPPTPDTRVDGQEAKSGNDTIDVDTTPRNTNSTSGNPPAFNREAIDPPEALRKSRSVTAPAQLTIITSPPSKPTRTDSTLSRTMTNNSELSDCSSSVESFHTVQSWHSPISPPLPPSPPASHPASPKTYPYPHDNISLPKRPLYSRELSEITEITVAPETPRVWEMTRCSSNQCIEADKKEREEYSTPSPRTPTLVDDIEDNLDEEHFEITTPSSQVQRIRHRPTTSGSNSRRRAFSPLPPAANIFSPSRSRPRHLQTARHFPTVIIQKTYEILLSPPSHLIHLMLEIASKIASGQWRGVVFGFGESGEKVVSQWDYEGADVFGDGSAEDDYGISLAGKQPANGKKDAHRRPDGKSWEID